MYHDLMSMQVIRECKNSTVLYPVLPKIDIKQIHMKELSFRFHCAINCTVGSRENIYC